MQRSQTVEGLQLLVYLEPHVALFSLHLSLLLAPSLSAHPQWNHRSMRRSFGTTRGPIKWLACLLCFIPGPCLRSLAPWLNPRNNSAAATGDGGGKREENGCYIRHFQPSVRGSDEGRAETGGPSESSVSKVSIGSKKCKLIASRPLCTVHLVIGCAGQPTQAVTPLRASLLEAKWCLHTS